MFPRGHQSRYYLDVANLPRVGFRAGRKQSKSTVSIRPLSPSGQDLPGIEQPILFQGDQESGANLVGQILFPIQEEGLYWFGIFLDGTELTRVPLRIVYQQVLIAEGAIGVQKA